MTTQITIRIPDELVAWLDAEVDAGRASSRTHAVTRALARARRRQISERDLQVVLAAPADPDQEGREQWQLSREYPDMGEPARVQHPEGFPELNVMRTG